MAEIIAVVPARGGSKGIPRKNLAIVAGRSLLEHTIRHAQQSSRVDRVIVSTDDAEIAAAALQLRAEVVRRPSRLGGDEATSESALLHVLESLLERGETTPELLVFLQVTSPCRFASDIDQAVATLERQGADSLFSASRLNGFVWRQDDEGLEALTYEVGRRPRRQEIGADWLENGSIYVFKPWVLKQCHNRLGGKVAVFPMDPLTSFQVDEPADLPLIEKCLEMMKPRLTPEDLKGIELLVLDFDGVLTDNRVLVSETGAEAVLCHRGDGMGLEMLRAAGMETVVLSKERNAVVEARCRKLGLTCHQGEDRKLERLKRIASERSLVASAIAFVGNDVNDLEALKWAGVGIAVDDSHAEALCAADRVTRAKGGYGAVREVCDALLAMLASRSDAGPPAGVS